MGLKAIIKKFVPQSILLWRRNRLAQKKIEKTKQRMQEVLDAESSYGLNTQARDRKIIVSLTSYPARFSGVHYAIRSMLAQTVKADRIILYVDDTVSSEQYPGSLTSLEKYGIEILPRPLNLKPHKKYYYAMKENPDDIIITVDDDQIYPADLIEKLLDCSRRFPNCVVAARAHEICFDPDGNIKKYNDWIWESKKVNVPSLRLCATGVGGVFYPPHCMHEDLLKFNLISRLSLNNDDLWLKIMQVLVGTKVVVCSKTLWKDTYEVLDSQITALNYDNVGNDKNDVQMINLITYYNLKFVSFSEIHS